VSLVLAGALVLRVPQAPAAPAAGALGAVGTERARAT